MSRLACLVLVALSSAVGTPLHSAETSYTFSTIAGRVRTGSVDAIGHEARFGALGGLACGPDGSIYAIDGHAIRQLSPNGVVTTLAGAASTSGLKDATGPEARFYSPESLAVDAQGNLYVADTGNSRIRKITPNGAVTTLVRGGSSGTVNPAQFDRPSGIAVDASGFVYVTEVNRILKISPQGIVTDFVGSDAATGVSVDGVGSSAKIPSPLRLAFAPNGDLYFVQRYNPSVRRVTPGGVVTTVAGAETNGDVDGTGTAARFNSLRHIAVDSNGNIYVTEWGNRVRVIDSALRVSTFAGGERGNLDANGPIARFDQPAGLASDFKGNLYVADFYNNTIRRITARRDVLTVAGPPALSAPQDGIGRDALFTSPRGIVADRSGNLFITDGHGLRKLSRDGKVTTYAGSVSTYGTIDGPAAEARFVGPTGLAIDRDDNLYVVDSGNDVIRKITPQQTVTTFAGTAGIKGFVDGAAATARFNYPVALCIDPDGNLYVADARNSAIRKITPSGLVTTIAGGHFGYSESASSAATAQFEDPKGIARDSAGNLYVADYHVIRKITPAGEVLPFAGRNSTPGYADGTGTAARFSWPSALYMSPDDNLYVLEWNNQTIRRITPAGVVTTIAGQPGSDNRDNIDGVGTAAHFDAMAGIAGDAAGNLYVTNNTQIRQGVPAGSTSPFFTAKPEDRRVGVGSSTMLSVTVIGSPAPSVRWQRRPVDSADFVWLTASANYAGVTTSELTISGITAAMNGDEFRCIASNGVVPDAIGEATALAVEGGPLLTGSASATFATGVTGIFQLSASGTPAPSFEIASGQLPSWASLDVASGRILGTPLVDTSEPVSLSIRARNSGGVSVTRGITLRAVSAPVIVTQPSPIAATRDSAAILEVAATSARSLSYQWFLNDRPIPGATRSTCTISPVSVDSAGIYQARAFDGGLTTESDLVVLGITMTDKNTASAPEFAGNILHPTGRIYDQMLLAGATAAVRADSGQVTRTSYLDLDDDLVQVEFSGAGTLTLQLSEPSGPTLPSKYNQTVPYMKGHARIVIAGADETTNLSIFSVGSATALNQGLFKPGVVYDGVADVASVAISSRNGKFGSLRAANANFFSTEGVTGLFAPGVEFMGPVFIGNIAAFDFAIPCLLLGRCDDSRITGGDLAQPNGRAVRVSGILHLAFTPGTTSHGDLLPAQPNRGRLEWNGRDVTRQITIDPLL